MGDAPDIPAPTGVDQEAWNAAVAAIRDACGWHVAPVVSDKMACLVYGQTITLKTLKVDTINSVTIGTDVLASDSWALLPDSPTLWLHRVPMCRPTWWPDTPIIATVDLTHGFAEWPRPLAALAQEAASRGMEGSIIQQVGQVRYGGSGTVPGSASWVASQVDVIAKYKLAPRP